MNALSIQETGLRSQFVGTVAKAFDRAGIDHVILHGYGADSRDSDLDLSVAMGSLGVVDLLLRSGALGRLLQRFDYDVPWCRYYVLASDEPERRYRQLDVACDPWGISRYGPAMRAVLKHRRRVGDLTVPEPAAEVLYLAVKRARKGVGPTDLQRLQCAFDVDPRGASALLVQEFGSVGEGVAGAIADDGDLKRALAALSDLLDKRRRSPLLLGRRGLYESRRAAKRLARPTGLVVGLAGPDGVGKSTLGAQLKLRSAGAFRAATCLHLGPGVIPSPGRLLRRRAVTGDNPHGRVPSGRAGSSARVVYLALDSLFGWPARMWLPRVRSTLVVLERGLLDLAVDPRRYRLRRSPRMLGQVARLVLRPDLVLLLDASAPTIHARKPELPVDEISRQLVEWRAYAAREPRRFRTLDATEDEEGVLAQSLDAIDEALAARQGRLFLASLALECLGGPTREGKPYTIISARGLPRWLLPQGLGPLRAGLYRPASRRHQAAAVALACRARSVGGDVRVDCRSGLAPRVAAALRVREVELAAALPREHGRRHRVLISVRSERRTVAYAKVSREAQELEYEATVLEAVARCRPEHFVVPSVIDLFQWRDCSVLLLRAHPVQGYTDRDVGRSELDALVELALLSNQLAPVLRGSHESFAVHGDFCGWNTAPLGDGRLAVWDWEDARVGVPLEDLFHWRVQRLVHFGRENPAALVDGANEPDATLRGLCRRLEIDPVIAPAALAACLERGLERSPGRYEAYGAHIRRLMLAMLEAS